MRSFEAAPRSKADSICWLIQPWLDLPHSIPEIRVPPNRKLLLSVIGGRLVGAGKKTGDRDADSQAPQPP